MKTTFGILVLVFTLFFSTSSISQEIQFNYYSPVPGSEYINPEQVIALKTGEAFSPNPYLNFYVKVVGSKSGKMLKTVKLSRDGYVLFINPWNDFIYEEKVEVTIHQGLTTVNGNIIDEAQFEFYIRRDNNYAQLLSNYYQGELNEFYVRDTHTSDKTPLYNPIRNNNYPSDYPVPNVSILNNADDGYIFFTPLSRTANNSYGNYLTIWDNYGIPIFYRQMDAEYIDFKALPDGTLTYCRQNFIELTCQKYFLMDSSYNVIDSLAMGNGYCVDPHDMLLLQNGNYLMMAYDPQIVDMSEIVPGGNPTAVVIGLVIQEVDKQENVYFQWRSWDHFEITDATPDIDLTAASVDYVHGNAFDFDLDGNLLLSSRHLDEITKINYTTGSVIWRMGLLSSNNQFTFESDPYGFSHQHDVRVLDNGNITIYDNGNLHSTPFSQAIEYQIDETDRIATRVWNYRNNPDIFAFATGSTRRLENGNTLIGWGLDTPIAVTEVDISGNAHLEMILPDSVGGYRALKYPWETNLFCSNYRLAFGNYAGSGQAVELIIEIFNHSSSSVKLTSAHNHSELFDVASDFPITLPAEGSNFLTVSFLPSTQGQEFEDILTLNYDNLTNTQRISWQLNLEGIWDEELPLVEFDPTFNASNIDPSTEVQIFFSEAVRKANGAEILNSDIPEIINFKVDNIYGSLVAFSGAINDEKDLITIYPQYGLDELESYYVEIIPGTVEDEDGNEINHHETTRFTTGELVSIEETNPQTRISVLPNPFTDQIRIISEKEIIIKVEILSMQGEILQSREEASSQIELNTGHFSPSAYLIRITTESDDIITKKIIKQ